MDPEESNLITFNLDYFKKRLSHHLAFQIQVLVGGNNIHHMFLDEEYSTCVMYFPCWRALGSPTTLKSFDGRGFQPHGLLQSYIVTLNGKTVSVDIKVVDAPLDYNLLLGHSWFYAMTIITSSVFHILRFPHQGKIIIVDQLEYTTLDLHNLASNNVPFLGWNSFESVGVGLLKDSSLMGVFPSPAPPTSQVSMLNMISTQLKKSLELFDPLVVPGLNDHSSSSFPSSLKNETDPPPSELSLTLDRILEPYFPLPSENVPINNQTHKQGKKKSHRRKRCLGGKSLASEYHVGEKPLASIT
jgi:hypothetical protein